MKKPWLHSVLTTLAAASLAFAACADDDQDPASDDLGDPQSELGASVEFELKSVATEEVTALVEIVSKGDGTTAFTVNADDVDEATANVHSGKKCNEYEADAAFFLEDIVDGTARAAEVPLSLHDLQSGDYVVVVTSTEEEAAVYCGAVPNA